MIVVVVVLLAVFAFWYYAKQKASLAIRSLCYLKTLDGGCTPEESNSFALSVDVYSIPNANKEALHIINETYKGNQFALIAHARAEGFRG